MSKLICHLILLYAIFLASCKKDDLNKSINKCQVSLKDSSFKVYEVIGLEGNQKRIECDIIVASRNLTYFSANDSLADDYIWKIGNDPKTFRGRTIQIMFDKAVGYLDIELQVIRNASNVCYNSLTGKSIYRKTISVLSYQFAPLIGTYYGFNKSNTGKSFTVEILNNGLKNIPDQPSFNYNYNNEIIYGSCAFFIAGAGTYDPNFGAYATSGFGYLVNGKQLEIDYQYRKPLSDTSFRIVADTFYGIKQ